MEKTSATIQGKVVKLGGKVKVTSSFDVNYTGEMGGEWKTHQFHVGEIYEVSEITQTGSYVNVRVQLPNGENVEVYKNKMEKVAK